MYVPFSLVAVHKWHHPILTFSNQPPPSDTLLCPKPSVLLSIHDVIYEWSLIGAGDSNWRLGVIFLKWEKTIGLKVGQ